MHDLAKLNMDEALQYGYVLDDSIQKVLYDQSSHEAWLAARKEGIGGSDVAAIMGLNPYNSALSVYKSKQADYIAPEPGVNLRKGSDLEEFIFQKHVLPDCPKHGWWQCCKPTTILVRKETPWLRSSLDGLAITEDGDHEVIEIKFVTEYGEAAWNHSEYSGIPAPYYAQVQSYMWTTGAKKAYVYALFDRTWEVKVYEIDRNDFFITEMLKTTHDFYTNNLCMNIPPRPTLVSEKADFAEALEALKELESVDDKPEDPEMSKLCESVIRMKHEIKTLESNIDFAMDRLGELSLEGKYSPHFKVSTYTTNRIDTAKLKKEYPEVAEACTKQDSTVRTTIK